MTLENVKVNLKEAFVEPSQIYVARTYFGLFTA